MSPTPADWAAAFPTHPVDWAALNSPPGVGGAAALAGCSAGPPADPPRQQRATRPLCQTRDGAHSLQPRFARVCPPTRQPPHASCPQATRCRRRGWGTARCWCSWRASPSSPTPCSASGAARCSLWGRGAWCRPPSRSTTRISPRSTPCCSHTTTTVRAGAAACSLRRISLLLIAWGVGFPLLPAAAGRVPASRQILWCRGRRPLAQQKPFSAPPCTLLTLSLPACCRVCPPCRRPPGQGQREAAEQPVWRPPALVRRGGALLLLPLSPLLASLSSHRSSSLPSPRDSPAEASRWVCSTAVLQVCAARPEELVHGAGCEQCG